MAKVYLDPKKDFRVSAGHPWIYANEVAQTEGSFVNSDIVEVYNSKNFFIGKGYINSRSQILVRLLTRNPKENIDRLFFEKKIKEAWQLRQKLGYQSSCRVIFGEADGLPALVVDKFDQVLVIQTLALGIDKWKKEIVEILNEVIPNEGIYERNDAAVRKLEGMEEISGFLSQPFETKFNIEVDGVKFAVDVASGQKTGFFHDQQQNRMAIAPLVKDASVLDAFSYTGSFGLYASHFGAKEVLGIDISKDAISLYEENIKLNGMNNIKLKTANVFDELKLMLKERRKFDVVMLDPPAFTKSRKQAESALNGYKEINLRGMQLTKPGGYLVTSSCSHFIYPEEFKDVITQAADDAKRIVRQVVFQSQSPDHPIIWNIPETSYLKFAILQVM